MCVWPPNKNVVHYLRIINSLWHLVGLKQQTDVVIPIGKIPSSINGLHLGNLKFLQFSNIGPVYIPTGSDSTVLVGKDVQHIDGAGTTTVPIPKRKVLLVN